MRRKACLSWPRVLAMSQGAATNAAVIDRDGGKLQLPRSEAAARVSFNGTRGAGGNMASLFSSRRLLARLLVVASLQSWK